MEPWQQEMAFNLLHEITETRLMEKGMKYDEAHEHANSAEMTVRKRLLEKESTAAKFAEMFRTMALNLQAPDLAAASIQLKYANAKEKKAILAKLSPQDRKSLEGT